MQDIYYALNARTINSLMKGNVDMSATTGEAGEDEGGNPSRFSDVEVREIAKQEQEVELFTVETFDKSRWLILSIS